MSVSHWLIVSLTLNQINVWDGSFFVFTINPTNCDRYVINVCSYATWNQSISNEFCVTNDVCKKYI